MATNKIPDLMPTAVLEAIAPTNGTEPKRKRKPRTLEEQRADLDRKIALKDAARGVASNADLIKEAARAEDFQRAFDALDSLGSALVKFAKLKGYDVSQMGTVTRSNSADVAEWGSDG